MRRMTQRDGMPRRARFAMSASEFANKRGVYLGKRSTKVHVAPAEIVVQRAVGLQAEGRHLLLAGDPVAAGEVVAAPSADKLDAIAACLLDVNAETQTARLTQRGDDPRLFDDHRAFADWMRGHARDPRHMPHVLTTNGWEAMRWERLGNLDPSNGGWAVHVIDTSECSGSRSAQRSSAVPSNGFGR
jgi:hypothetical protein